MWTPSRPRAPATSSAPSSPWVRWCEEELRAALDANVDDRSLELALDDLAEAHGRRAAADHRLAMTEAAMSNRDLLTANPVGLIECANQIRNARVLP